MGISKLDAVKKCYGLEAIATAKVIVVDEENGKPSESVVAWALEGANTVEDFILQYGEEYMIEIYDTQNY